MAHRSLQLNSAAPNSHPPVYKLAQLGKIPTQKVGRHRRFHRHTLVDWIAGKKHVEEKNADTF